jgi:glycerol-3-phosphate acyltransferase PlsY
MIAALGAVLGHNFTCWLQFKGGKGIATSAGVLAAMVPIPFLITLGGFLVTLALTRYVSLASILGAAILPFAVAWTPPGDRRLVVLTAILSVLAIVRHKANISRLLNGTERRIGQPKPSEPAST